MEITHDGDDDDADDDDSISEHLPQSVSGWVIVSEIAIASTELAYYIAFLTILGNNFVHKKCKVLNLTFGS